MATEALLRKKFTENANKINYINQKVRTSKDPNFIWGMRNGDLRELYDERQKLSNELYNICK